MGESFTYILKVWRREASLRTLKICCYFCWCVRFEELYFVLTDASGSLPLPVKGNGGSCDKWLLMCDSHWPFFPWSCEQGSFPKARSVCLVAATLASKEDFRAWLQSIGSGRDQSARCLPSFPNIPLLIISHVSCRRCFIKIRWCRGELLQPVTTPLCTPAQYMKGKEGRWLSNFPLPVVPSGRGLKGINYSYSEVRSYLLHMRLLKWRKERADVGKQGFVWSRKATFCEWLLWGIFDYTLFCCASFLFQGYFTFLVRDFVRKFYAYRNGVTKPSLSFLI